LIAEEELKLDKLVKNLAPAMGAMEAMDTAGTGGQECSEGGEWKEDIFMEAEMSEPMETTRCEEGEHVLGLAMDT
jgi:hypothetical protein